MSSDTDWDSIVSTAVRSAAELLATDFEPDVKPEQRLRRAMLRALADHHPELATATEVKPDLPNWPRSPTGLGGFDLAIGPSSVSNNTTWPVLAELKWSTSGGDKVGEALWDAFKLAHASVLPGVEAAYLITGAPGAAWERNPGGRELFGDARTDTVDLLTRHARLWRWNRDHSSKDWPQKFPRVVQTRLVDDVTARPAAGDWRVLISSVTAVDGWIDAFDGWPQGVEPPPG